MPAVAEAAEATEAAEVKLSHVGAPPMGLLLGHTSVVGIGPACTTAGFFGTNVSSSPGNLGHR